MEKKNSLFSPIWRSCADFGFYREIYAQPFGKTLQYLLILVLLATIFIGIRNGVIIKHISSKSLKWIEENVPLIEIKDGVVSASVQQPFFIKEKDFTAIIDTTGVTTQIGKEYKSGLLLTKDKLIVKQDEVREQVIDLSKVKEFRLDKDSIEKWKRFLNSIIIPFAFILQFIYFFIAKIIQILFAGVVILAFKQNLKFSNVLNICVYALTPVTLLSIAVILITTRPLIIFPLVYLGMYIAFIAGGLKQIQTES